MNNDEPVRYEVTRAGRDAIAAHRAPLTDRYVVTAEDGWTDLWCRGCTAGSEDYIGTWEGGPNENGASIIAARRAHETTIHREGNP